MKINKNIAYRVIDGEVFIVTSFDKTLHNLNEMGTFIFQEIEKKKNLQEIIDKVCQEFKAEKEVVEKDIYNFIQELKEKQILINEKLSSSKT